MKTKSRGMARKARKSTKSSKGVLGLFKAAGALILNDALKDKKKGKK